MDIADTDLVMAVIDASDALHERGVAHIGRVGRLRVPLTVGIELLLVARKKGLPYGQTVEVASRHFELENEVLLKTAAEALDDGSILTPFDAVHAAAAYLQGVRLHTGDKRLVRSGFPVESF